MRAAKIRNPLPGLNTDKYKFIGLQKIMALYESCTLNFNVIDETLWQLQNNISKLCSKFQTFPCGNKPSVDTEPFATVGKSMTCNLQLMYKKQYV